MNEYQKRMREPNAETVLSRMRQRLAADPGLYRRVDTDPQLLVKLYDREKQIMASEQARELRRAELFAEDPEEDTGTDWDLELLKDEARESGGSEESIVALLDHVEGKRAEGGDDE